MKKLMTMFLLVLTLSLGLGLTACKKNQETEPAVDPLVNVVFVDATYEYDGSEKSIAAQNLPEGYTVEYVDNNKVEVGTYRVVATIKDKDGNVAKTLTAMLVITAKDPTVVPEPTPTVPVQPTEPTPTVPVQPTEPTPSEPTLPKPSHGEPVLPEFTVTFKNYDGSILTTVTVKEGETATYAGLTPTRASHGYLVYEFIGWDKSLENVTSDFEVTAKFKEVDTTPQPTPIKEYTVTFKNHDGAVLLTITVEEGETATYTGETPTKEANGYLVYEFIGWDKSLENVTSDLEVIAEFSETDTTPEPVKLDAPVVIVSEEGLASWEAVENAIGYAYKLNEADEITTTELSLQLADGDRLVVKALGDEENYLDSDYSVEVTFVAPVEPEPTPDQPTNEYTLEINGTSYPLVPNPNPPALSNLIAEYMVSDLTVAAGEQVVVKHNGVAVTPIGPEPGSNNLDQELKVVVSGTYIYVYFKVWEDGGHSIWMTGNEGQSGDNTGGEDNPTTVEYTLEINSTSYPLVINANATLQQNQVAEYMALDLAVTEGDQVVVKKNGTAITNIGPDSGNNNVDGTLKVVKTGEAVSVYFKVWKDGHSIWMTGNEVQPGGSEEIPTGLVLYVKPNANWKKDGARFAAYFFGASGNTWVNMTDPDGDGIYECIVPDGNWTHVIFCRMSGSSTSNNWNNKWNQTADLSIPGDGATLYTVKENTWDKGGGTWSIK